jgi:flagellar hook-associated protein 1 FlgK
MATINSAFSIITGALQADQAALSVVAGNVANANTPGYTEKSPTFIQNSPVTIGGSSYGTGVTSGDVVSKRDRVLLDRIDQQQQLVSASSSRLDALNALQTLFTPNSGTNSGNAGDIGSDLTKFFNSFSSLEASPTNNALRQQVLSSASTLAADISHASRAISRQAASLDQEAAAVASKVNALTTSIAKLSQKIQSAGTDVPALEDQRQQDLQDLSKLIGIHQIATENNGLTIVTTSGEMLVSQDMNMQLAVSGTNPTQFSLNGNNITSELASGGGQLGGLLTARDQDLSAAQAALDQLAYTVSTQINAQNAAGYDLNGAQGGNIFAASPATITGSAAGMAVTLTDPNGIAASQNQQETGDNSNAIALAALANTAQALLNGQNPTDCFAGFVTQLGSTISQVTTENTAQNASITQLQSQNNALTAVNLNDEASAITTFERSYQAASQVFAILDNLMSAALNMGIQSAVS